MTLPFRPWEGLGSTLLHPDGPGDRRGQVPTTYECEDIEHDYGLTRGCTLVANGARWFYLQVATFGEELGEKPCVEAHRYTGKDRTSDEVSILNVWRVE